MPPPAAGPIPFALLTAKYAQGNPENNVSLNPNDIIFIRTENYTRGWHNWHQHGFDFQLVQYETYQPDGQGGVKRTVYPAQRLENKDTWLVPGRPTEAQGSKTVALFRSFLKDEGRVGRIVAYPKDGINDDKTPIVNQPVYRSNNDDSIGCSQYDYRSNGWLAHCHILDHSGAGMMSVNMITNK